MQQVMSGLVERILDRMRVTAVIPDSLASEVQALAGRRNLSESIVHALWEWVDQQKVIRSARGPGRSGFPPFRAGPGTCRRRAGASPGP